MSEKKFLFIDNVEGDSTDSTHPKWIQIHSINFEMDRLVDFKLFHEKLQPESSNPVISKIVITKPHCVASPGLFTNFHSFQKAKMMVDIVREKEEGIMSGIVGCGTTRFESEVCYVSGYKLCGMSDTMDRIELTVSSLSMTYNPGISVTQIESQQNAGYHFQRLKSL